MKPYSLTKAKEIVRLYNETRRCEEVTAQVGLSLREVKYIVRWLSLHDPCNRHLSDGSDEPRLALPTSRIWLQFLYSHNVSPRTAAVCVAWPYARVLTTCGGEEEWLKTAQRRCVLAVNEEKPPEKRQPGDPTPEQLLARARELREARDGNPRFHAPPLEHHVEAPQYSYDGRIGRFNPIS